MRATVTVVIPAEEGQEFMPGVEQGLVGQPFDMQVDGKPVVDAVVVSAKLREDRRAIVLEVGRE